MVDCVVGKVIKLADITVTILAPAGEKYEELNEYSLVARADCGDVSVLLTGDAEAVSEAEMLANAEVRALLDCDILKVAHHGGKTSTSAAFIEAISPQIALIPARADRSEYAIMRTVINRLTARGVQVYDTCAAK